MENKISERKLAESIIGCPSYQPIEDISRFEWLNNILSPIFNVFQLEKSRNNIHYYKHNLRSVLEGKLITVKEDNYKDYMRKCVDLYYNLFKSNFYHRYKVLSFTTPYDTSIIPLKYNIEGKVDLIIKSSYGVTLTNYVYHTNTGAFYYNVQYSATKLQIAARCFKLLNGKAPDFLCVIVFTKSSVFKKYFKYLDEPYEKYVQLLMEDLLPIKRKYCYLCKTCTAKQCAPWKTREKILV